MKKRILLTIIAIISFVLYIEKAEANTCTTETNINCNNAEECDNDKNWEYKCSYTSQDGTMKAQIYYNNCLVKVFLNNKDVTNGWSDYENAYTNYSKVKNEITHDDIKKIVTKSNACPALLYSDYSLSSKGTGNYGMSVDIRTTTLYVEKSVIDNINNFLSRLTNTGTRTYYIIDDYYEDKPIIGDKDYNSCEELFDEDIKELINTIMKWIRIIVPILLIVFGIMDFTKATFDKNEDDMKKSREKFIKRIIAAVFVFLVPIFVNLILEIANSVWSNISPDTCVK